MHAKKIWGWILLTPALIVLTSSCVAIVGSLIYALVHEGPRRAMAAFFLGAIAFAVCTGFGYMLLNDKGSGE